jgi:ABC-type glycerol-3-phosphate transport system permease component
MTTLQNTVKRPHAPIPVGKIVLYAVLLAGAITMLVPFLWMILTSFKSVGESIRVPTDDLAGQMDHGQLQRSDQHTADVHFVPAIRSC